MRRGYTLADARVNEFANQEKSVIGSLRPVVDTIKQMRMEIDVAVGDQVPQIRFAFENMEQQL